MSNKGLVMALEGKQAVVLTNNGEFRKVNIKKNNQPNVGEEIYLGSDSYFSNLSSPKWGLIAASILLILVLPMYWQSTSFVGQQQEVAYVNIDINPSIELALNDENEVIKVRGLNNDGTQLLDDLKLIDTDVEMAVEAITDEAEEKGYINPSKENLVVISLSAKDNTKDVAKYSSLSDSLEKKVEKNFIDNKLNGRVDTIKTSGVMRNEAEELELSVGKYAVLLSAWESGLKITADDLRSKSIAKAIKSAGGDLGVIVGKAHENQNLDELALKYAPDITKAKINKKDQKSKKDKDEDQFLKIDEENEVNNPKSNNNKKGQEETKDKASKNNGKDKRENKNSEEEEVEETIKPVNSDTSKSKDNKNSQPNNANKQEKEVKNNKETNRQQIKDSKTTNGSNKDNKNYKDKKITTPKVPSKPSVPKVVSPSKPR